MNGEELNALQRTSEDRRRMQHLAERICASIGQSPRRLPSRTALAIEGAARPLTVVACALIIGSLVLAAAFPNDRPEPGESMLAAALEGTLPRAQDVYAVMTGITVGPGAGR